MGYIWAIYYIYLLLPFSVRYPDTRRITRRQPYLHYSPGAMGLKREMSV